MKIPFKWEVLRRSETTGETYEMRAKVFGGWIFQACDTFDGETTGSSSATAFIPDPNHEWEI